MVRRHSSYGRRDEGKGRIRITGKGRIAGSQNDRQVAEKAFYAKTKFKLKLVDQGGGKPRYHRTAPWPDPSLSLMTNATLLETDWQCRNHAKIWSVTSDAELGGDTEHRAIP